jgi:hypothetical protein
MDKQREMFEEWWEHKYSNHSLAPYVSNTGVCSFETYKDTRTQMAWEAWQAAQKAQWRQTTTLPPRYEEVLVYPPPTEYCNTAQYGQLVDGSCDGWYYSEYEFGCGVVFYECNPTHWMPLPQEPTE